MDNRPIIIFWFRRDLRISDNIGLTNALQESESMGGRVLPIFIFDPLILEPLPANDHRINFIYQSLKFLDAQFRKKVSSQRLILKVWRGRPTEVFSEIITTYPCLNSVYTNEDYEPYARKRDQKVEELLQSHSISFRRFTDQVIFRPGKILKKDGRPYTVFTPFKKKWLSSLQLPIIQRLSSISKWKKIFYSNPPNEPFPSELSLGITPTQISIPPLKWENIIDYDRYRDFPECGGRGGTYAGIYLRFGLVSIRELVARTLKEIGKNSSYLSELVWREFFMHILWHFPQVVKKNFQSQYDTLDWRNNPEDFQRWCRGETGYPLVDAGIRELNQTGFMSNRVRMVTASFLCKHLLIDWRWGEKYFSQKLFDFELSSNNGNWQWCASTGCDATPYFRIFNPLTQAQKFDPDNHYIRKWVPEFSSPDYLPMIDHKSARERALQVYGQTKLNFVSEQENK